MSSVQIVPSNSISSASPGIDVLQDPATGGDTQDLAFISEFQAALGFTDTPLESENPTPQPIVTAPIGTPERVVAEVDPNVISLQSLPGFIADQLSTAANISASTSNRLIVPAPAIVSDDIAIKPMPGLVDLATTPSITAAESVVAGTQKPSMAASVDASAMDAADVPMPVISDRMTNDYTEVDISTAGLSTPMRQPVPTDMSGEMGPTSIAAEFLRASEQGQKITHSEITHPGQKTLESQNPSDEAEDVKLALITDVDHLAVSVTPSSLSSIEKNTAVAQSTTKNADSSVDDSEADPVDLAPPVDASAVAIAAAHVVPSSRVDSPAGPAQAETLKEGVRGIQKLDSAPTVDRSRVNTEGAIAEGERGLTPNVISIKGFGVERTIDRPVNVGDITADNLVKPADTDVLITGDSVGTEKDISLSLNIYTPSTTNAASANSNTMMNFEGSEELVSTPKELADALSTFGIMIDKDGQQLLTPGRRLISSDLVTAIERANLYSALGVTDSSDVPLPSEGRAAILLELNMIKPGDSAPVQPKALSDETRGIDAASLSASPVGAHAELGAGLARESMSRIASSIPVAAFDVLPKAVPIGLTAPIVRSDAPSKPESQLRQSGRSEKVVRDVSPKAIRSTFGEPVSSPRVVPPVIDQDVTDRKLSGDNFEPALVSGDVGRPIADVARHGVLAASTVRQESPTNVPGNTPFGAPASLDRTLTLDARAAAWDSSQIKLEVNKMIREGGGEVVIHLKPKDEGPIRISVKLEAANLATVVVDGGSETVRSRLDQGAEQLRSQMAQLGLNLQLDMRQGGQSQGSNAWSGQPDWGAQPPAVNITAPRVAHRPETSLSRDERSGVNLRA